MKILALDIATTTGYCLIDKEVITSGTFKITGNVRGQQFLDFNRYIYDLIDNHKPDTVIIEKPFFRGAGTRVLMPLVGIAEMVAEELNCSCLEIANVTVKKFTTGKAKASKEEMIEAIQKLGYNPIDDNEADAIALALYARDNIRS